MEIYLFDQINHMPYLFQQSEIQLASYTNAKR